MTEINKLTEVLGHINLKLRNLEIETLQLKNEKKKIKKKLLETCLHKHVIQYRYYDSGMHRAEYSTKCKSCDQDLNFNQYCKAETTEKRDR